MVKMEMVRGTSGETIGYKRKDEDMGFAKKESRRAHRNILNPSVGWCIGLASNLEDLDLFWRRVGIRS